MISTIHVHRLRQCIPTNASLWRLQVNFYYGQPAPYAESIAPSHHSNYAYYDDEEDTWEMPNFPNIYNDTYMKSKYQRRERLSQFLCLR